VAPRLNGEGFFYWIEWYTIFTARCIASKTPTNSQQNKNQYVGKTRIFATNRSASFTLLYIVIKKALDSSTVIVIINGMNIGAAKTNGLK